MRGLRRAVAGEVRLAASSMYEELVQELMAYFSASGLEDLKKKSWGSVSGRIWFRNVVGQLPWSQRTEATAQTASSACNITRNQKEYDLFVWVCSVLPLD